MPSSNKDDQKLFGDVLCGVVVVAYITYSYMISPEQRALRMAVFWWYLAVLWSGIFFSGKPLLDNFCRMPSLKAACIMSAGLILLELITRTVLALAPDLRPIQNFGWIAQIITIVAAGLYWQRYDKK